MRLVRALALYGVLGAMSLATACSNGGGATPPIDNTTTPTIAETPSPLSASPEDAAGSPTTVMSCTTSGVTGNISWVSTSATKFQLRESNGSYVYVDISSTTKKTYNGLTLKVGRYALVQGSGSPIQATSVTLGSSAFSTSCSTPPPSITTSTSGVRSHLMTADYFEGEYGTFRVSPASAASHLTYAQTSIDNSTAIRAAGIKTQYYVNAGKLSSGNPLTAGLTSSAYAHTCSGAVVTESESGKTYPLADPRTSQYQTHFGQFISSVLARARFDMIFEDNSGALSPYATYPAGKPCNYTDSSWVNGYVAANNTSSIGVLTNGLNTFPSSLSTMFSPNIGMVSGRTALGGNAEHCFSDDNQPEMQGNSWIHFENTQLNVLRQGKMFQCMARNTGSASANIAARKWVLASLLLTYNPNLTILQEEFGTPSGLHVFPESQFVPMNPVASAPSDIGGLRTRTGAYGRQYSACYLNGRSVGACAIVVDRDSGTERFPYSGYTHTLTFSGYGVTDGGTVSASGPAPPASLTMGQAVIAIR